MSEIKHDLTITKEDMLLIMKAYMKTTADMDRSKMSEQEKKLLEMLDKARDCGYFEHTPRYGGHYMTSWYEGREPVKRQPKPIPPAPIPAVDI